MPRCCMPIHAGTDKLYTKRRFDRYNADKTAIDDGRKSELWSINTTSRNERHKQLPFSRAPPHRNLLPNSHQHTSLRCEGQRQKSTQLPQSGQVPQKLLSTRTAGLSTHKTP